MPRYLIELEFTINRAVTSNDGLKTRRETYPTARLQIIDADDDCQALRVAEREARAIVKTTVSRLEEAKCQP